MKSVLGKNKKRKYLINVTDFFYDNYRMINRRVDGRYDDVWGPAVLCILLVVALVVS